MWEVRLLVSLRLRMPRALYGWLKPWLVRHGCEIQRAHVVPVSAEVAAETRARRASS